MNSKRFPVFAVLLCLIALGGYALWNVDGDDATVDAKKELAENERNASERPQDKPLHALRLYTSSGVTTPQLPLLKLEEEGYFKKAGYTLEKEFWKNIDDLRGLILAEKGDIWVGHIEGFLQAFQQNQSLTLVAVTGWKKFYLLSADPEINSLDALLRNLAEQKLPLSVAPVDGPGLAVLRAIMERRAGQFPSVKQPELAGKASQQLSLELMRGDVSCGMLPEPLVSVLLRKNPKLHVVAGLEDEYSAAFGGPARLPLVGIAVNRGLAEANPLFVQQLALDLKKSAEELSRNPEEALKLLPEELRKDMGEETLKESFSRDMILAEPAWMITDEISSFWKLIAPQLLMNGRLPKKFIFHPAAE